MSLDRNALLESLLEGPCLVVDVLPERVPESSSGCWFEVEDCFLEDKAEMSRLARKFRRIFLKLACYSWVDAFDTARGEWVDCAAVGELADAVAAVVEAGSGGFAILFPYEECLLSIESGVLSMVAYGSNERFRTLLVNLAESEGLFCWEGLRG